MQLESAIKKIKIISSNLLSIVTSKVFSFIASQSKKRPGLVSLFRKIAELAHMVDPETVVVLDYPIHPKQRWDFKNPHPKIYDIINKNRNVYKSNLQKFLEFSKFFADIPEKQPSDSESNMLCWANGWMPAFDGIALYSHIAIHKPKIYLEVGSGNSTKFSRKAINDHNLDTTIISIDPFPRADINALCDEVIRKPMEDVDLRIFDRLDANDILFIDSSHRAFMNSDVTAIFLDVIPNLKPGVFVEIHDVMLPYDYIWIDTYYSEQYLLAAYLLAEGSKFDIVLPNFFISFDDELKNTLAPIWENKEMKNVPANGCSFWIRIKS